MTTESALGVALPLARLLIADSAPLKQTFGEGSTRDDLRSVLPMYASVKGWKIDDAAIEALISCLFAGKVLGGSTLTW